MGFWYNKPVFLSSEKPASVTGKLKRAKNGKEKSPAKTPPCIIEEIKHGRYERDGGNRDVYIPLLPE